MPQVTLVPVIRFKEKPSSQVVAVGYLPELKQFLVEFHPGKSGRSIYPYANVTPEIVKQLLEFPSIGSAFIHLLKNKPNEHPYSCQKGGLSHEEIDDYGYLHLKPGDPLPSWWPPTVPDLAKTTAS